MIFKASLVAEETSMKVGNTDQAFLKTDKTSMEIGNTDESLPKTKEINGPKEFDANGSNGDNNGEDITEKPDSDNNDVEANSNMDLDKVDAQTEELNKKAESNEEVERSEVSDEKVDGTDKTIVNEEADSSSGTEEPSTKESENKSKKDSCNYQKDSKLDKTDKSYIEDQDVKGEAKEDNEEIEKKHDDKIDNKEDMQDADKKDKKQVKDKDKSDSAMNKTGDLTTKGDNKESVDETMPEKIITIETEVVKEASKDIEEIKVLDDEDPLTKATAKDSNTNDDSGNVKKTTITFKPVVFEDSDDEEMIQVIHFFSN